MMTTVLACKCDLCSHVWVSEEFLAPAQCPKCGSRLWNEHGKRRSLNRVLFEHRLLLAGRATEPSYKGNEKLAALCHAAVHKAIRLRILIKPSVCENCPGEKRAYQIVAHHRDYAKPLEVTWLCLSCHAEEHHRNGTRAGGRKKATTEIPAYLDGILGLLDGRQ